MIVETLNGCVKHAMFDLLIQNGRLIDPAQSMDGRFDVAFHAGRVADVAQSLSEAKAAETIDATDLIVAPGMIDLHVHVYDSVSHYGIPGATMRSVASMVS